MLWQMFYSYLPAFSQKKLYYAHYLCIPKHIEDKNKQTSKNLFMKSTDITDLKNTQMALNT